MRTPKTPWPYLDKFPPPYVRLLAKRRGAGAHDMAIPDAEIAVRADLTIDRVRQISRLSNWEDVSVGEMRRFFIACDFDPTSAVHRQRVTMYEKVCNQRQTAPFTYLRKSPFWESEFLPLIQRLPQILSPESPLMPNSKQAISHARTSPR